MDVHCKKVVEVFSLHLHFYIFYILHTKSITPILCAVLSVIVKITFFKISDVPYLRPQEAVKISKVAIVSSFKLFVVSVKISKVVRLLYIPSTVRD